MKAGNATRRGRVPLSTRARLLFDRMRACTPRMTMAARLGVNWITIEQLEHGGLAVPEMAARVTAALERLDADRVAAEKGAGA